MKRVTLSSNDIAAGDFFPALLMLVALYPGNTTLDALWASLARENSDDYGDGDGVSRRRLVVLRGEKEPTVAEIAMRLNIPKALCDKDDDEPKSKPAHGQYSGLTCDDDAARRDSKRRKTTSVSNSGWATSILTRRQEKQQTSKGHKFHNDKHKRMSSSLSSCSSSLAGYEIASSSAVAAAEKATWHLCERCGGYETAGESTSSY